MTDSTDTNPLNAPWSLHFDRDGTEDFGIICDADMNDLVASHLPQSPVARLADRPFGTGCFWLPEEGDKMPRLVRQMRLMAAAPKLLEAAKRTLRQCELILETDAAQTLVQLERMAEPLASLRSAVTEAEADEPRP